MHKNTTMSKTYCKTTLSVYCFCPTILILHIGTELSEQRGVLDHTAAQFADIFITNPLISEKD